MKSLFFPFATVCAIALTNIASGEVVVRSQHSADSSFFQVDSIPLPATDDAAATAKWQVIRGRPDNNSASLAVLSDGRIPRNEDSPKENFFFAAGTLGGCIGIDLGREIEISQVATYSWHSTIRAPQVYSLYGAGDSVANFTWNQIRDDQRPEDIGWEPIAKVDSRSPQHRGGQHAVLITNPAGHIGAYRYLLLEIQPTETDDPFGNTFFSEIDVLDRNRGEPNRIVAPETQTLKFADASDVYQFIIDTTAAPELATWSDEVLKPIIQKWYPQIVEMLPSEGFVAPRTVRFRYLPGDQMEGVPAYAQRATVSLNANWFIRQKNREAAGAVVHEMVHVVQSYQSGRQRGRNRDPVPGWITEGIPDYIRWFLFEPQSKGALLDSKALAKARHDASYRVSANFIDWVIRNHDPGGTLLKDLNAEARQGRYSDNTWKRLTGNSESELADAWRNQ
jgi:hypothetical protein